MSASLESVLVCVWQQSLIDKKKTVDLDAESYPIRQTSKSKPKQVDFRFEDRGLRGLEQNPNTKSRWAKLAREGKQVMQFLEHGRYIAVVVDGKFTSISQLSDLRGFLFFVTSEQRQVFSFISELFNPFVKNGLQFLG